MGRTGHSLDDQFPPRSGGRAHHREDLRVGRKRGGPGIRWLLLLLNLNISLRIIIVEPGGPRMVAQVLCFCVYGNMMSSVSKENDEVPKPARCCCDLFF